MVFTSQQKSCAPIGHAKENKGNSNSSTNFPLARILEGQLLLLYKVQSIFSCICLEMYSVLLKCWMIVVCLKGILSLVCNCHCRYCTRQEPVAEQWQRPGTCRGPGCHGIDKDCRGLASRRHCRPASRHPTPASWSCAQPAPDPEPTNQPSLPSLRSQHHDGCGSGQRPAPGCPLWCIQESVRWCYPPLLRLMLLLLKHGMPDASPVLMNTCPMFLLCDCFKNHNLPVSKFVVEYCG